MDRIFDRRAPLLLLLALALMALVAAGCGDDDDDDGVDGGGTATATESTGDGETPADGETPDGETPDDGETPADGETPDGETPDDGETATEAESPDDSGSAVSIADNSYSPDTLTVPVGTTVTWTWDGSNPHSVTASDGSFDSGAEGSGFTFEHTFDEAGTYDYSCTVHGESMSGSVEVTE